MNHRKVAVMVFAYNAEKYIESILERIPKELLPLLAEVYVLDDYSRDDTFQKSLKAGQQLGITNLRVFRTPVHMGYGGSQKIGYTYAISRGFDFVVTLHGDDRYAPEFLPHMIAAFEGKADFVLGTRMPKSINILRDGMLLYKWIGNKLMTTFVNRILRVQLSEFHTGYRGFRISTLQRIPFRYNSDDFHFDTEILIQFISAGAKILEVPISTHNGDTVCHLPRIYFILKILKSIVNYRLFNMGIFYNPFLDFNLFETESYYFKKAPNTLHQYVLAQKFSADMEVLDFGAAAGYISAEVAKHVSHVVAVDYQKPAGSGFAEAIAFDLDGDFCKIFSPCRFDIVLALDVIEHLKDPEDALKKLAFIIKPGGTILASTANIAFIITRLMLMMGVFNYGKRGILDKTHKRLFTEYSFKHLFRTYGFKIMEVRGFGPPIRDMISSRFPYSVIDAIFSWLAKLLPHLFAYNILIVACRLPSLEEIYKATHEQNPPLAKEHFNE